MGSFDGTTLHELASDNTYPTWQKRGIAVVKKIPGGDKNVIQKIGVGLPTLALPAQLTAAQLTSLYGKVGNSGTLVFSFESTTATLESIDTPTSLGIGNDIYFATLNLIRSSPVVSIPSTAFLTEAGDTFITEASDVFIQE